MLHVVYSRQDDLTMMRFKRIIPLSLLLFFSIGSFGQNEQTYDWTLKDNGLELGLIAFGWGASLSFKERADKIVLEDLDMLIREDVWAFDRGAIGQSSSTAPELSDFSLYTGIALPFLGLADKNMRSEALQVVGMALEAYMITDGVTNFIKATAKRFRPYTYDQTLPLEDRLTSTARQSFSSGHTSGAAVGSFLFAQVFSDLNPDSKLKPYVWAVAATVPALTGYWRYKAGRHFPSDIIVGYGIGAAAGILVPKWHKRKNGDIGVNVFPISGGLVGSVVIPLH